MKQVFIGIDLGTTNSAIAYFDGESTGILANALGENLTPSVVRLDQRGEATVGRRAGRFLDSDPQNTRSEFKRLMGTETAFEFPRAQQKLLPEELSSHILRSLLADAADHLGSPPKKAVISTPALFELPQNHATTRAGELAGLEEVLLIQEPVASAIAAGWREDMAGMWLVFDLGGGTLDVSLLETVDGRLRVVDHSGDNFLGGKDFDNALVDWVLNGLRDRGELPALSRANPESQPRLKRLKAACESAKIELSRVERTDIFVADLCCDAAGQQVDVDVEISRPVYEALIEPLVDRGLGVCLALLDKARVAVDEVGHIVFVGGPTLTPLLRQRIGAAFGGRIVEGIDPMTIVARGAALYAATAGLNAHSEESLPTVSEGLVVRLEYPAVTADSEPFVVGRFLPKPGEVLPERVRIVCLETGEAGSECEVSPEGSFVQQVVLKRHSRSNFHLHAYEANGGEISLQMAGFAIVHGVSVADPPLSRSVGVARADDTVLVYFKKGTALPARKTFSHQTVQGLNAHSDETLLSIPIVQGEYHRAHRNCLIGTLVIGGVKQKLPAGSRVEVTLHLDRSGQLHAMADVPDLGQRFENVVHVLVPTASSETLIQEFATTDTRCSELLHKGFSSADKDLLGEMNKISGLLAEVRGCLEAVRGEDQDAMQRMHRLLLEINASLDQVEERGEWPALIEEANERIEIALSWVAASGSESEQHLLDRAVMAANSACQSGDAHELDRQIKAIGAIANAAFSRHPENLFYEFEWFQNHLTEATDVAAASRLIDEGRTAVARDDRNALQSINRQLSPLFPGTAEERVQSFGSGVH